MFFITNTHISILYTQGFEAGINPCCAIIGIFFIKKRKKASGFFIFLTISESKESSGLGYFKKKKLRTCGFHEELIFKK
jgi:hypothetical protein